MLINVLLDKFLNTKVSQGSVATHLMSDGIFSDQFITQSLLSSRVKKKSVNICLIYGQLSTGLFFCETWCVYITVCIFKHEHVTCFIGFSWAHVHPKAK